MLGRDHGISRWSLAAAIAVHAALLAVLVTLPPPHRPPPRSAEQLEAPDTSAVDVEGETPATALAEPASPLASASAATRVPTEARANALEIDARERTARAEDPPREPPAAPPETAPPFRGVTMGGAPIASAALGLELGAHNRFATGEGPPSTTGEGAANAGRPDARAGADRPRTAAEAKRAVEAALREPARQRERELGLGPEGPVLKALGEGASASAAPVTGRAVFVAVADGAGMIVGIDVVECDGGRAGWAQAAELARAALKGKKLRLPSTAKRAEMRIEVTSAWKLPTGHDPGTDVSLFGVVPLSKGEGKQSTKVAILDPIPKLRVVETKDMKLPVVSVNVDVISIAGDPANIGAKPRRIVHTRLIDSKVL